MPIVDTHVHYWEPSRPDRPWDVKGVDIGRPLTVEELLAAAREAGVDRIVEVTPTVMGEDNRYAIEGAERYPEQIAAVFGRFDPTADRLEERLSAFSAHPKMAGMRLTIMRPEQRSWLSDGTLDRVLHAAAARGIIVAIYAPGEPAAIGALARRNPGALIIVDHMTLRHSDPEPFALWHEVLELERVPNLIMKVDYFPEVAHEPFPFSSVDRYAREIYERFGPGRLVWGSNFPPSQRAATYRESVCYFQELPFIPADDRRKIMGDTFLDLLDRARRTTAAAKDHSV